MVDFSLAPSPVDDESAAAAWGIETLPALLLGGEAVVVAVSELFCAPVAEKKPVLVTWQELSLVI